MSSFQSCSTFSSENLSASDGEEGNTSDHSHSGPLEGLSASQEEHLDELLSHTPDIPIDISTQSDGLSDKECAVRRVKTQISLGKLCSDEHSYEVSSVQPYQCHVAAKKKEEKSDFINKIKLQTFVYVSFRIHYSLGIQIVILQKQSAQMPPLGTTKWARLPRGESLPMIIGSSFAWRLSCNTLQCRKYSNKRTTL